MRASSDTRKFPGMPTRLLSAILAVFALFFAPVAMANGGGMAHSASQPVMTGGHCDGDETPANDARSGLKTVCANVCAACVAIEPAFAAVALPPGIKPHALGPRNLIGVPSEHETPPPRSIPEL